MRARLAGERRRTSLLLIMVVAAFGATPVALGDAHHEFPEVIAVVEDQQQAGKLWAGEWTSSETEGRCGGVAIIGYPSYPQKSARFTAPGSIRLEFQRPESPESVSIKTWRKVRKEDGMRLADGPSREPSFRMEQVTGADGSPAAWAAVFDARRVRHYYVGVRATWAYEETCGGPRNARWVLHLEGI